MLLQFFEKYKLRKDPAKYKDALLATVKSQLQDLSRIPLNPILQPRVDAQIAALEAQRDALNAIVNPSLHMHTMTDIDNRTERDHANFTQFKAVLERVELPINMVTWSEHSPKEAEANGFSQAITNKKQEYQDRTNNPVPEAALEWQKNSMIAHERELNLSMKIQQLEKMSDNFPGSYAHRNQMLAIYNDELDQVKQGITYLNANKPANYDNLHDSLKAFEKDVQKSVEGYVAASQEYNHAQQYFNGIKINGNQTLRELVNPQIPALEQLRNALNNLPAPLQADSIAAINNQFVANHANVLQFSARTPYQQQLIRFCKEAKFLPEMELTGYKKSGADKRAGLKLLHNRAVEVNNNLRRLNEIKDIINKSPISALDYQSELNSVMADLRENIRGLKATMASAKTNPTLRSHNDIEEFNKKLNALRSSLVYQYSFEDDSTYKKHTEKANYNNWHRERAYERDIERVTPEEEIKLGQKATAIQFVKDPDNPFKLKAQNIDVSHLTIDDIFNVVDELKNAEEKIAEWDRVEEELKTNPDPEKKKQHDREKNYVEICRKYLNYCKQNKYDPQSAISNPKASFFTKDSWTIDNKDKAVKDLLVQALEAKNAIRGEELKEEKELDHQQDIELDVDGQQLDNQEPDPAFMPRL